MFDTDTLMLTRMEKFNYLKNVFFIPLCFLSFYTFNVRSKNLKKKKNQFTLLADRLIQLT